MVFFCATAMRNFNYAQQMEFLPSPDVLRSLKLGNKVRSKQEDQGKLAANELVPQKNVFFNKFYENWSQGTWPGPLVLGLHQGNHLASPAHCWRSLAWEATRKVPSSQQVLQISCSVSLSQLPQKWVKLSCTIFTFWMSLRPLKPRWNGFFSLSLMFYLLFFLKGV